MKKIAILIASFALVLGARSQATDPRIVGIAKMAARTEIVPFANDAEVKSGMSSYLINVSDWEWTESEGEVTFTATFKRPSDWQSRSVIVRIAQATSSFALDVNGERVGYSQWGGGRAEFDVTGFVKEFYNSLTITIFRNSVANRLEEPQIVPDEGFGSVEVVSQPMVRVEDIIVDARVDNRRGVFGLQLAMQSTILNNRRLTLQYELAAPDGRVVVKEERTITITPKEAVNIPFRVANLDRVEAWSAASPKLYTLTIRSMYETRPIEVITRKVGFTDFSFSHNGQFMVAGKPVNLVAVKMKWEGSAEATESAMRRAKQSKANALWVDGEPQREEFYAIADRVGMYVIDHADIKTGISYPNVSNDPNFLGAISERIIGAYRYSRIHPSVVAYFSADETADGYCMAESYLTYKKVEKVRPLIHIGTGSDWASDAIIISILSEQR